jgi:hypothetical protein
VYTGQGGNLVSVIDNMIGAPVLYRVAISEITIAHGHGDHARGTTGLDVTQIVTNVEATLGTPGKQRARQLHRVCCRFGAARRIAADDTGCALGVAKPGQERQGEALRLVGDDTPWRTAPLKSVKELLNSGKERRFDTNVLTVVVQEAIVEFA